MRALTYSLFTGALAGPVARQVSGLPSCADSALSVAESAVAQTGCTLGTSSTDIACFCNHSSQLISAIGPTLQSDCSSSDLQSIANLVESTCSSVGVTVSIPSQYTSSTATSSTSGSAAASATASNSASSTASSGSTSSSGTSGTYQNTAHKMGSTSALALAAAVAVGAIMFPIW